MLDNFEKFIKDFSWKIRREEDMYLGVGGYWLYCTGTTETDKGPSKWDRQSPAPSPKMKYRRNADFVDTMISNFSVIYPSTEISTVNG
jgi:hypothetical protein